MNKIQPLKEIMISSINNLSKEMRFSFLLDFTFLSLTIT